MFNPDLVAVVVCLDDVQGLYDSYVCDHEAEWADQPPYFESLGFRPINNDEAIKFLQTIGCDSCKLDRPWWFRQNRKPNNFIFH